MSVTQTAVQEAIELGSFGPALFEEQAQSAAANDGAPLYPSGAKLVLLTVSLVLSILLAALDSTIIATAIPSITDQFGSIANIAWYGTAYAITNTSFASAWGKAYQLFPLKPTMLAAISVFEIGNVICATSKSSTVLIFGRVVAGLGGGGIMTGSFIIIALTSPPRFRAAYMGILGLTFGTASVVGPLLGGALTDGPGWRFCFWVSLPIGAVAAGMMAVSLSQPQHQVPAALPYREKMRQMDLGGGLLITTALVCFVLAMHWGGQRPWSSGPVIASLIGAVATVVLFIVNEYKMGMKAMLQTHLFRSKVVVANFTFICLLAGLYFPLLYILPIQFQSINNDSAAQSGIRLIPLVLGISVFTMISNGALTFLKGYYNPFMTGGSILGALGMAMIFSLRGNASTGSWIGYEVLAASGIGLSLQIPMLANQAAVSAADMSAVTSTTLFFENIGTTIFTAASEAAFTNGLLEGLRDSTLAINPQSVVDAGATQLRHKFSPAELPYVLDAYLQGCKTSYKVGLACAVAAVAVSLVNTGPSALRHLKRRRSMAV
jgi:MFS family permease